jgi:hypothetical protein
MLPLVVDEHMYRSLLCSKGFALFDLLVPRRLACTGSLEQRVPAHHPKSGNKIKTSGSIVS